MNYSQYSTELTISLHKSNFVISQRKTKILGKDIQGPMGKEIQGPMGKEIQGLMGKEIQGPMGKEIQGPI